MRHVSTFINSQPQKLLLVLEPLGEPIDLLPKEQCHILIFGDRTESLDVVFSADYVSVYPSRQCDVAIFKDGQLIAGPIWTADDSHAKAEYQAWLDESRPRTS
jgi:hypothetical protein